jgi:predicted DNA-binding transcriptional regulator AlpA
MEKKLNEPLLVDVREAARLCGIGRSTWFRLHSAGRVPLPIKLGRRTLWNRLELALWTAAGCPSRLKWEIMKKNKNRY